MTEMAETHVELNQFPVPRVGPRHSTRVWNYWQRRYSHQTDWVGLPGQRAVVGLPGQRAMVGQWHKYSIGLQRKLVCECATSFMLFIIVT